NPDGYPWMYIAPSATGEGIVASAIINTSDDHEEGYWFRIVVYSSRDNGNTWTQQTESDELYLSDSYELAVFGQLMVNISASYILSHLGLVSYLKLYAITQEAPALPEVSEDASRRTKSSRRTYGCKDKTALNYTRFAQHKQS